MKKSKIKVLFFAKKNKPLATGEIPIYMRIAIDGQKKEIATKRAVLPEHWDGKTSRVIGKSNHSKELNLYLESLRAELLYKELNLQEAKKEITIDNLLDLTPKEFEKEISLLDVVNERNQNIAERIHFDLSPVTLQKHISSLKHLTNFLEKEYKVTDIPLEKVDSKFISKYDHFLRTSAEPQHNTVSKHMRSLKQVIISSLKQDLIRKDPFISYQITEKKSNRVVLTQEEIDTIIKRKLLIPRLALVRDLFIFQVHTGLAYKDLFELEPKHIVKGNDRGLWISTILTPIKQE